MGYLKLRNVDNEVVYNSSGEIIYALVDYDNSVTTTSGISSFSYGIENPDTYSSKNPSNILVNGTFYNLYDGQYSLEPPIKKVYGKVEYEKTNDSYVIRFYADSDRTYQIAQYVSQETSGSNVSIVGSGVGCGMSGVFSYDLGI